MRRNFWKWRQTFWENAKKRRCRVCWPLKRKTKQDSRPCFWSLNILVWELSPENGNCITLIQVLQEHLSHFFIVLRGRYRWYRPLDLVSPSCCWYRPPLVTNASHLSPATPAAHPLWVLALYQVLNTCFSTTVITITHRNNEKQLFSTYHTPEPEISRPFFLNQLLIMKDCKSKAM